MSILSFSTKAFPNQVLQRRLTSENQKRNPWASEYGFYGDSLISRTRFLGGGLSRCQTPSALVYLAQGCSFAKCWTVTFVQRLVNTGKEIVTAVVIIRRKR